MKKVIILWLIVLALLTGLAAQYPDQDRINQAIAAGVSYLESQQRSSGNWDAYGRSSGATALALLALMKSGVSPQNRMVRRGLAYIYRYLPQETYERSLLIMALEAAYGQPQHPPMPQKIKNWMRITINELLACWSGGYWSYRGNAQGDLSNTQFAVLALNSAIRCGFKVPDRLWTRLLRFLLAVQQKSGPRVGIVAGRKGENNQGYEYCYASDYRARGWGYTRCGGIRGSMVCAGISSLLIARNQLQQRKLLSEAAQKTVQKAIDEGLGWLAYHFTVEQNPKAPRHQRWHLYYLYGLERVGRLGGYERIGTHDWYREGAKYLVNNQNGNGSWQAQQGSRVVDTCFALLFLTKATTPLQKILKPYYPKSQKIAVYTQGTGMKLAANQTQSKQSQADKPAHPPKASSNDKSKKLNHSNKTSMAPLEQIIRQYLHCASAAKRRKLMIRLREFKPSLLACQKVLGQLQVQTTVASGIATHQVPLADSSISCSTFIPPRLWQTPKFAIAGIIARLRWQWLTTNRFVGCQSWNHPCCS